MMKNIARGTFKKKHGLWVNSEGKILVENPKVQELSFKELHDAPLGGHRGIRTTTSKIRQYYYWPDMENDIRKRTAKCEQCQRGNPDNRKMYGLLQELEQPRKVNEIVALDLIGPFPASKNFTMILLIIDVLTRRIKLIPLAESRASTIAEALINYWIVDRAVPCEIRSDRGSQFTAKLWQELEEKLGTKIQLTSGDHPQSNGTAERAIRTVEEILRKTLTPVQERWSEFLATTELAYNTSVHSSIKTSPLHLELGYQPRLPAAIETHRERNLTDVWKVRAELLDKARQAIILAQANAHTQHDKEQTKEEFKEGELVLLSADYLVLEGNKAKKLKDKLFGPFQIVEKLKTSYRLDLPEDMKNGYPVFHQSLLRKYNGEQRAITDLKGEVERIYGHKQMRDGTTRYYVKLTTQPITALSFKKGKDIPREMIATYYSMMRK